MASIVRRLSQEFEKVKRDAEEQTHPRQAIQPEQGAPDIAENAPLTANRGQQPEIIGASAASTKPGESQELQQGHPHRDHRDVLNPFDFGVDPASLK